MRTHARAPYARYGNECVFIWKEGFTQLPTTQPGPPVPTRLTVPAHRYQRSLLADGGLFPDVSADGWTPRGLFVVIAAVEV